MKFDFHQIVTTSMVFACVLFAIIALYQVSYVHEEYVEAVSEIAIETIPLAETVEDDVWVSEVETEPLQVCIETETEEESIISEEDLELFAHLVYAEAGGEPEEGKRLVIDVVLNRVNSPMFPDTLYDVIYQKNPRQFSVTAGEKLWKKEPTEDIYYLILEEYQSPLNTEILYFSAGRCANGKFWKKVGNHYFATQKGAK